MIQTSRLRRSLILPFLLSLSLLVSADPHDKDPGLFSFVSRPDIRAPRWKVNIVDEDAVTPGYWFVAPFEHIDQHEPGNGWIGPHIYDGNGQLVWSGVALNRNLDALDFKISNVRGKDYMTFLVAREGNGYIVDNTFEVQEVANVGVLGRDFNPHEFYFVGDGTRAITIMEGIQDSTEEQAAMIGQPHCRAQWNGFRVWDTETWKPVFEWSSFDHLHLTESSLWDRPAEAACNDAFGWDFLHINSVDQDHNGDYYMSSRHADTIYKISKDDGHVIWRLDGRQEPDGEWDMEGVRFSRQHNVRFRGFDGTHEFISILDNARGEGHDRQQPTHDFSRGLLLSLKVDEESKVARLVSSIDHPHGEGSYAPRRGNYQVLDNDHIFMGWSEQATHSEHAPDGRLLMEATLETEWLGTYRSYKYPFVGRPSEPPVAVSSAYSSKPRNSTTTMVHVSWNGATEIASWDLYKTDEMGKRMIKIFSKKKEGFETTMAWDGYASYVIVQAVDRDGNVVGSTDIVKTHEPQNDAMSAAVAEEMYWLQEVRGENDAWNDVNAYASELTSRIKPRSWPSVMMFVFGVVISLIIIAIAWCASTTGLRRRLQKYQAVANQDDTAELGQALSKQAESGFRDAS